MFRLWGSLRAQLVLLVVVTTVPLMVWVTANAYWQARAGLERARTNLHFASSMGALHVAQIIESARATLVTVASTARIQSGLPEGCATFFRSVAPQLPAYGSLGVFNPDGHVRCSSLAKDDAPVFAGDRRYFQEAMGAGRFAVSTYTRSRISQAEVILFAQPVRRPDDGRVTGVAYAAMDLRTLQRAMDQLQLPPITRFRIMDRDGTVLAASSDLRETVGSRVRVPVLQRAVASAVAGIEDGEGADGRRAMFALVPVGAGTGVFVSVSLDREVAIGIAAKQIGLQLLGLFLLMLIGCYLAWRAGGRAILEPTRQILEVTQQLQMGRGGTRVGMLPRSTVDELVQISAGFNRMADALQQREGQHVAFEAQVRHAHDQLDLVLNSMKEAVLAVDQDSRLLLSNHAAAMLFDLARPRLPAARWPAHFGLYHAGTDRLLSLDRLLRPDAPERAVADFDLDVRKPGGADVRTLRCSVQPLLSGANMFGILMVMTDITDIRALQAAQARNLADLEELQRKLVEALETGRIGNWEFDLAAQRLWWSDETYVLFGLAKGGFDGRFATVLQHIHPDDRDRVVRQRDSAIAAGEVHEVEYRIVLPDGSLRWMNQIGRSYCDARGRALRRAGVVQDITERKLTEQALLASEQRYVALFKQSPLPMWVSDPASARFLAVNEAAVAQYGYSREEFSALTLRDIRPASEWSRLEGLLHGAGPADQGGERWLHRRKDGSEFPVEIVWKHIPHGDRRAMFVVALDVSARVRAEAEVHDDMQTLRRMNAAAQAIAGQATLQGTLQQVVVQARGVVGAHLAVITLAQGDDWAQAINKVSVSDKYGDWQGREIPAQSGRGMHALVCETNQPLRLTQAEFEAHPRRSGFGAHAGDHPPVRGWLAVPLVGADRKNMGVLQLADKVDGEFSERDEYVAIELAQLAATAIEKTRLIEEVRNFNAHLEARIARRTAELARQEALFRALAEQAPQVVWTADTSGAVSYLNRHWFDLTGGEAADGLGYGWMTALHPDDLAGVRTQWRLGRRGKATFSGVRRIRALNGSYHTMSYRAAPVHDALGQVSFWVGIDTDITEFKAVEAALVLSNRELAAFSYSVSHDLRSPLSAIDGFSRLLARQSGMAAQPQAQHYLTRIQAGVAQMGQMIEGLLALAQVSRASLRSEPVRLDRIARDILERLQASQPDRRVAVTVEEGLTLDGDPRLLQVAMENLLGNAWKFSAQREDAAIAVGQLPGQRVFYVQDNGAGFDMAYSDKLFGVFQRLHSVSEFPGTGIGLATVQRIVARHEGRVWAQSAPGSGATFFFSVADGALVQPGSG